MAEQAGQIAALFGDWPETLIWTCLEDRMGQVYADDDQLTNFGVLLCTVTSTVAELAATENIVKAPAQTMRNAKFLLKYMIILKNV